MIWLAFSALVAACVALDRRYAAMFARFDARRRPIVLPGRGRR